MAKKKKNSGQKAQVYMMLVCIALTSAVFLSTAMIFYIGLIPSFVAFFVDQSPKKSKAVTVLAFNFMGCLPFVGQLWAGDGTLALALNVMVNPVALVVIYSAAGVGYIIDWVAATSASSILYNQAVGRQTAIGKRQEDLVKRWGPSVTGKEERMPVEEEGEKKAPDES